MADISSATCQNFYLTGLKFISRALLFFGTLWILASCSSGGGGDSPEVLSVSPADGDVGVELNANVTANFVAGIDSASVNDSSFTLKDSLGNKISGAVVFDSTNAVAEFTPLADLALFRVYNAGVSSAITKQGKAITPNYWSFTTRDGSWGTLDEMMYAVPELNGASDPHIAVAPNGDAIAVWLVVNSKIVYASKYTATTGTWGTAGQINSLANNTLSDLQIAMDSSGNALAVWSIVQPGGKKFVHARYYDSATGWDAAGSANIGNTSGLSSKAQVAFDGLGNAFVVWLQDADIYYNIRYSSATWEGVTLLESGSGTAHEPQLAVRDNGDAVAVWGQSNGSYDEIYYNFYHAGSGWDGELSLNNTAQGAIPQVAVDQYGNAMVVWIQGTATPYSLQASYYNVTTTSWETIQQLDSDAHISTTPQVVMHHKGKGMAVWRTIPAACSPCRTRYDTFTGSTWTKKVRYVDAGGSNSTYPQLAMDPAGNAMVVWIEASSSRDSAWYNRYQTGKGWGTATLLESDDTNPVSSPAVGMSNTGITFATWIQSNGSSLTTWVRPFN